MNLELKINKGTDRDVGFQVCLEGESKGELMLGRAEFTKLCDLLYSRDYTVSGNVKTILE